MFERRLKIILWTLLAATAALIARAGQISTGAGVYWSVEADDLLAKHKLIETSRGSILDAKAACWRRISRAWMPALTMPRLRGLE